MNFLVLVMMIIVFAFLHPIKFWSAWWHGVILRHEQQFNVMNFCYHVYCMPPCDKHHVDEIGDLEKFL